MANFNLQCLQYPYYRRLRPQHVGLKLRFSSLVSVGRLKLCWEDRRGAGAANEGGGRRGGRKCPRNGRNACKQQLPKTS